MKSLKADRPAVLVTGVGAPPGVSIMKALRHSELKPRIIATDAEPLSVGLFRADAGYLLPRADRHPEDYLRRLTQLCSDERIDLIVPGSEIEMKILAPRRQEIEEETGATLALNDAQWIDVFTDKWRTVEELRGSGIAVPDSVLPADDRDLAAFLENRGYPLIIKPRFGSGSKQVFRIESTAQLEFFRSYVPQPILQEYLEPDDEEYTVGVYKSRSGAEVFQIAFHRSLAAGLTYKAKVVFAEDIAEVCRAFARAFDVWGAFNIQLRRTAGGVKVFEVNLRPSSSAVMRAHFGFNELDLTLRDLFYQQPLKSPEVRGGYAFRYWDEVYVRSEEGDSVKRLGRADGAGSVKLDLF